MITLEKAKGYVKAETDTFSHIEVDERGFLHAHLQHPSSLDLTLIVHPADDALILRVRAQNIGQIDLGRQHERVLRRLNATLLLGRIAIDDDGDVFFEINHPCLDGGADDPGPEVFERLLRAAARTARDIARIVMALRLKDARLPQDMAEKLLAETFGEVDDDQDDSEETL